MDGKELKEELMGLSNLDNGVVQGVLVLLQPSSQVVRDHGSVVNDTKVSLGVTSLQVWLTVVGMFAQKISVQLRLKGLIRSLGEECLLFKDGKKAHWLLKHVDALLQIHAEVNIGPVQTLSHIFLLLEGEHVGVEELLELLVDIVDADLLKGVEVCKGG